MYGKSLLLVTRRPVAISGDVNSGAGQMSTPGDATRAALTGVSAPLSSMILYCGNPLTLLPGVRPGSCKPNSMPDGRPSMALDGGKILPWAIVLCLEAQSGVTQSSGYALLPPGGGGLFLFCTMYLYMPLTSLFSNL